MASLHDGCCKAGWLTSPRLRGDTGCRKRRCLAELARAVRDAISCRRAKTVWNGVVDL